MDASKKGAVANMVTYCSVLIDRLLDDMVGRAETLYQEVFEREFLLDEVQRAGFSRAHVLFGCTGAKTLTMLFSGFELPEIIADAIDELISTLRKFASQFDIVLKETPSGCEIGAEFAEIKSEASFWLAQVKNSIAAVKSVLGQLFEQDPIFGMISTKPYSSQPGENDANP
jgi:hypothetical protein